MKIPLYCDIEYRDTLGLWLNEHGYSGAMAEVGVLAGSFSRTVLSQWKGSTYYMVDPWIDQPTDVYMEKTVGRDYEALYRECLEQAKRDPRIRIIRKMSVEAAKEVPDNSLDCVFIDANHAYGPVLADMDAWWPKVRLGGIFAGHDYGNDTTFPNFCEVKRAVDRWMSERRRTFVYSRCNSWWCVKR